MPSVDPIAMSETTKTPTLIYDGDCSMCKQAAQWVRENTAYGSIELLPCQDPERPRRFPQISTEDCMRAMQLIEPGGEVFSGERAFPGILARSHHWRWVAVLLRFPGVLLLARPFYALVARHRLALSSLFIKKDAPKGPSCGMNGDCD